MKTNPSVMMHNGISRQILRGNQTYGEEFRFGHSLKSLSPPAHPIISESDGALLPPLFSLREVHGDIVARILFEPSHGVSIDHSDPNVTDLALREALAWKTSLCKHYIRTQGWCPVGERCQFIHDLALQPTGCVNNSRALPRPDSDLGKIGDMVPPTRVPCGDKARPPKSHCWSHVQSHCRVLHCHYFHPQDIQPYLKYTPCPQWLTCADEINCPFKHPIKISDAITPDSPQILGLTPPARYASLEVNGTTYFDLIGQITSCDYDFTSRPTTPPRDNLSCRDQTNMTPYTPPPPPPSPVVCEEPAERNQTSAYINDYKHSMTNGQNSTPLQTRRQNSHTRRYSVAFKGSEATDQEHDTEVESFNILEP